MYKISFCIPSYNNARGVEVLCKTLLKTQYSDIQVVVVDNSSTDDTIIRLSKLNDSRFKLVQNTENIGAKLNWYNALEQGDGEWLYLVMGRDMLDVSKMKQMLDILATMKDDVGFLFDRKRERFPYAYEKEEYTGIDAISMFINMLHPTGSIFRRSAYRECINREIYFSLEHPYPENYLKRDILKHYGGKMVDVGLYCGRFNVRKLPKSRFETTPTKRQFFHPEKVTQQFLTDIQMIESEEEFNFTRKELDKYFVRRWASCIHRLSIDYKNNLASKQYAEHYGVQKRNVTRREMIDNIITAYKDVVKHYQLDATELSNCRKIRMIEKMIVQIVCAILYNSKFKLQKRPYF